MTKEAMIRTKLSQEQLEQIVQEDFLIQLHYSFDEFDCFDMRYENGQYKIVSDHSSLKMYVITISITDEGESRAVHFHSTLETEKMFMSDFFSVFLFAIPLFLLKLTFYFLVEYSSQNRLKIKNILTKLVEGDILENDYSDQVVKKIK